MIITHRLFQAFLECPTKCFFLAHGEHYPGNPYVDWVRNQVESYRNDGITRLTEGVARNRLNIGPSNAGDFRDAKWQLATNPVARIQNLESGLDAVQRISSCGPGKPASLVPIRFVLADKLTRHDKLMLAFDALILAKMLGRKVEVGRIIHGNDHASMKVKTSSLANEVGKRINQITGLISNPSPPDLILKRYCAECEFQERCRQKAIEKDDLSLLSAMSEKERKKLNGKRIFSITQLSYTFRARRKPKHFAGKRDKYHQSLKALAIREGKIHIVGNPMLKIDGTPVYLDVEGLPNGSFYYLIGIRFKIPGRIIQHSLWADDPGEWLQILLKDFKGVLVSDFYPAYDGLPCQQQKCLIHLIRNVNDDILKHPYDEELKALALVFARLVKPMIDTVDRHGLKSRFLGKHIISARRFYKQLSNMSLHSEMAQKLKDRLIKNENKLFTFLKLEGIPWNNNNAEHAVKAFATLRRIIGGVTTTKGIRAYMILLSICETCGYQKLDFLDFLRSGESNLDVFASNS